MSAPGARATLTGSGWSVPPLSTGVVGMRVDAEGAPLGLVGPDGTLLSGGRAASIAVARGRGLTSFDDFGAGDETLNNSKLPTGETWALTGTGAATTARTANQMVAVGNTYAYFDPGDTFARIDGAFTYRRRGSGNNDPTSTDLTLIVDSQYQVLGTLLHLRISPTSWILEKKIAPAGSFTVVAFGYHTLVEGAAYAIGMERASSTVVRIHLPDGTAVDVTDADFASITWRYPCWQIAFTTNSWEGRWAAVSLGGQTQSGMAALDRSAPAAAVAWLNGSGLTRRRRTTLSLSGAAGWYRIATSDTLYTFQMVGKVYLTSYDGTRSGQAELDVKSLHNTVSPGLTEIFSHRYNGSPITQVRLSSASGVGVYLDVNKANATAATLECEFLGLFVPNLNPVVGVSAGATGTTTVTLT